MTTFPFPSGVIAQPAKALVARQASTLMLTMNLGSMMNQSNAVFQVKSGKSIVETEKGKAIRMCKAKSWVPNYELKLSHNA